MQNRQDMYDFSGGDVVQMMKTGKGLSLLGHPVEYQNKIVNGMDGFDIVHLFNLLVIEDTYKYCLAAKKNKKPIVLSSLFWDKNNYIFNHPNIKLKFAGLLVGNKLSWKLMNNRWLYSRAWHKQKKVLKMANLVITTSKNEAEQIEKIFACNNKFQVIPVGINTNMFSQAKPGGFINKHGVKDFVLSVGRFERLKNQLRLIKACSELNIPLVLIGGANSNEPDYYKACQKAAVNNKNITIIPAMEQKELASAYAAAKLHIAPSWYETFSLTTLESIACGTNVVVTKNCPLKEYFGNKISYCDPASRHSIKKSIQDNIKANPSTGLSKCVLENYSWDKIAKQVLKAYKQII